MGLNVGGGMDMEAGGGGRRLGGGIAKLNLNTKNGKKTRKIEREENFKS